MGGRCKRRGDAWRSTTLPILKMVRFKVYIVLWCVHMHILISPRIHPTPNFVSVQEQCAQSFALERIQPPPRPRSQSKKINHLIFFLHLPQSANDAVEGIGCPFYEPCQALCTSTWIVLLNESLQQQVYWSKHKGVRNSRLTHANLLRNARIKGTIVMIISADMTQQHTHHDPPRL